MALDGILRLSKPDLCQHFICGLCQGLLIDAVALPECCHVYCKSCIVKQCSKQLHGPYYCPNPECRCEIHKTKPFSVIKNDIKLQTLVYKLFPQTYKDEMAIRRTYYEQYPNELAVLKSIGNRAVTSEDLGKEEEYEWLPRPMPELVSVLMLFLDTLTWNDDRPSKELTKIAKVAKSLAAGSTCYVVTPEKTVADIKLFLAEKLGLRSVDSDKTIVLLLKNAILQDYYTMGDIVNVLCIGCKDTSKLQFEYILCDYESFPNDLSRDAAVTRLFRKKPCQPVNLPSIKIPSVQPEPVIYSPIKFPEGSFAPKEPMLKKVKPFPELGISTPTCASFSEFDLTRNQLNANDQAQDDMLAHLGLLPKRHGDRGMEDDVPDSTALDVDFQAQAKLLESGKNLSLGEFSKFTRVAQFIKNPTWNADNQLPPSGAFSILSPDGPPLDCSLTHLSPQNFSNILSQWPVNGELKSMDTVNVPAKKRRRRRTKQEIANGEPVVKIKRKRLLAALSSDPSEVKIRQDVLDDHSYPRYPRDYPQYPRDCQLGEEEKSAVSVSAGGSTKLSAAVASGIMTQHVDELATSFEYASPSLLSPIPKGRNQSWPKEPAGHISTNGIFGCGNFSFVNTFVG